MKALLASLLLLISGAVFAQQPSNFNKKWYVGSGGYYSADFGSNPVSTTIWDTVNYRLLFNQHSSICDDSGNLILITDGFNIYNGQNNLVGNGDSIISEGLALYCNPANLGSQCTVILPFPDSMYMVINNTCSDTAANNYFGNGNPLDFHGCDWLLYNIVDMNQNASSGGGGIVGGEVNRRKQFADSASFTNWMIGSVRHGNGVDWWITTLSTDTDSDTDRLNVYHVSEDTVDALPPQFFPHPSTGLSNLTNYGQMSFSNTGKYLAHTIGANNNIIALANFNRCSGLISNHQRYLVPVSTTPVGGLDSTPVGICFSPNDSLLYISTFNTIWQFNIHDTNASTAWFQIASWDTSQAAFQGYTELYLSYDYKIYVGNAGGVTGSMSRIDNPNVLGAGAGWCPKCLDFPARPGVNSGNPCCVIAPPNMPNFNLGADPNCFLGTQAVVQSAVPEFKVYPNPASTVLNIVAPYSAVLRISDMLGREVLNQPVAAGTQKIDISTLTSGVYLYQFAGTEQGRALLRGPKAASAGRLIITH
jgi:hypothetical protein